MKKPPILQLTSIRFFLIAYIVVAHFIKFGTKNEFLLKFFSQQNVVVGAFFVLSGYIMAYVYTEYHSSEVRPINPLKFLKNRLSRMYPTYFFILLLFSPLFIYVELYYKHGFNTVWHAITVFTLTQAWFPSLGELWNSPTWFLSASLFAYALFPYIITPISKLNRQNLIKLLILTLSVSLLIKISYSSICGWEIMEGLKMPSSPLLFNFIRFNPVINFLEFLMGISMARILMLSKTESHSYFPGALLTLLVGILVVRTSFDINDMITRSALFIPIFLFFLTHLHQSKKRLSTLLSHPFLVYLGEISFSIYIVHGAIGQLFYKKVIKNLFFYQPINIFIFYITVLLAAILLYHGVEKRAQAAIRKRSQQILNSK
jgi:peptidoglycan/LPS O-acetylase OafA/YrhL